MVDDFKILDLFGHLLNGFFECFFLLLLYLFLILQSGLGVGVLLLDFVDLLLPDYCSKPVLRVGDQKQIVVLQGLKDVLDLVRLLKVHPELLIVIVLKHVQQLLVQLKLVYLHVYQRLSYLTISLHFSYILTISIYTYFKQ